MGRTLLNVENLRKHFAVRGSRLSSKAWLKAVDDVSFTIAPGETFSLVGESGCGKTTTAKMVLLLEPPTDGAVYFEGAALASMTRQERRHYRLSVQAVFQDPWSALSPRMRVSSIVAEPLIVARAMSRSDIGERVAELFMDVGLDPAMMSHFPHEFSGGQRQRIAIARAIGPNPKLVVLDEPVSSLDVSIRAEIMNLLKRLQRSHGLSYLLIAHDLATVRYLSHQVGVMYLGQIVEKAPSDRLFDNPLHPYTRALIAASLPITASRGLPIVFGEMPSPVDLPTGCRFSTRCPVALGHCSTVEPKLQEVGPNHKVACHLY